jgi:isopenicillin N synthase-like dioxygenase
MGTEQSRKVPELSLQSYLEGEKQDKVKFVNQLYEGLKDYGFIILNDHPIEQKKVDFAYQELKKFFSLSTEIKNKYDLKNGGQRGYTPFLSEHAKDQTHPDLKEFWHVGRDLPKGHKFFDIYSSNVWPTEVPELKEVLTQLWEAMDHTGKVLLGALGEALDVAPDFFSNMIHDGNSILRAIHYPPVRGEDTQNSIRAAAHEDINLITMLVGATDSGLELKDRDGKWLKVESSESQIVVDSGDMLSRITNEVIPATTHRVVNPDNVDSARYSMPFFVHPHPDAVLSCISSCEGEGRKYKDIKAHDFLLQRLKEIGLLK